jgi:glycosyltransferase involved in cell wall biosynthesis
LEIIVVDDGSADDSLAIAKRCAAADKRILCLQQAHAGQAAARNLGIKNASGDYLCFVDADDWIEKDYIEQLSKHIGTNDVIQSCYRRITNDGQVMQEKTPRHFYQFTSPCMRLYRTAIVPSFPEGIIYEDVIFSLRLWSTRPTYTMLPHIWYNYRVNPTSTTSQRHIEDEKKLYATLWQTQAPLWLKIYTAIRLKLHFAKR